MQEESESDASLPPIVPGRFHRSCATGPMLLEPARAAQVIPGFDQTKTDYDRTKLWKPFSDRKVRVGIVGHGVCQFGLAFDLQTHPNVELVAVSDLFSDRSRGHGPPGEMQQDVSLAGRDGQGRFDRGHLLRH